MKIAELLKVVDDGWVRKPEGFRVRFQTEVDGNWVTDYCPPEAAAPFDSDVVAWRSAWKLQQANLSGRYSHVNVTVVDDRNEPVRYYATGEFEVYNPDDELAAAHVAKPQTETDPQADVAIEPAQPAEDEPMTQEEAGDDQSSR